ncbi:sulfatase [Myxococcota bacterium]|nr:sulfatase [Myxococcota bacterium]MCZ7617925.1 sulfatase [Myxococcota bacterium]
MLNRILDSKWTYIVLITGLVIAAVASQFEIRVPSRPLGSPADIAALSERDDVNVVFLVIDTLRNGRLGSYGYERDTSPILDALAQTGVRFAHTEAQSSWTKASMASLWTGINPTRTGITRYDHVIPEAATMPAELFRDAGYQTFGVFRNGWVDANFGFSQGFDLYFKPQPSRTPDRLERKPPGTPALQGSDLDVTEAGVEFLQSIGSDKFLLYLHYMDVHQYVYDDLAASKDFGTSFSDVYDSAIHWTDRNVGRIFRELEEQGLADRTIVIIASDHGEAFYEHGLDGHARNLYREVTEVPLLLSLPFRLDPGITVDALVRNVDVWPTVLELVGLPPLPAADGQSLVPLMLAAAEAGAPGGSPVEDSRLAFAFLDRSWGQRDKDPLPLLSLRRGPYRLHHSPQKPDLLELYDHRSDPTEQTNLAEQQPDLANELRALSESRLEDEVMWETGHIELDEMQLNQLRALGYVVE